MDDDLDAWRRPGRGGLVFLAFFVAALTSAGTFFAMREWWPAKSEAGGKVSAIEVPAIVGMPVAQARELLDAQGLLLVLEAEREDAKVAAGSISAQVPLAGSRARRAGEVRATVSTGQIQATIPDVAKLSVEKATAALIAARLVVGPIEHEASADVPAGTVLGTSQPAGTTTTPGSEVRLLVSSGLATIAVPKLLGLNIRKAKEAIEAAKLKVGTTKYSYDEDRAGYIVLKQEPAPDAQVAPGTAVNLVVNEAE